MGAISSVRVTKTLVDRLKPGETLRDTDLRGFGVRRQQGAPIYFLQRKVHGRNRWFTIGPHGAPWTPDLARKRAHEIVSDLARGIDPIATQAKESGLPTVAEAAEHFMDAHGLQLKPTTRSEYQRLIDLKIIPAFGRKRIDELSKPEVARFHGKQADTPSCANFTLAVLSKLMNWAEDQGYRPSHSNPCVGIRKYRQNKRERYLSQDEFARLGQVLNELEGEESPFVLAAIRLLLFTGARLNEILTLRWSYVNTDHRLLLLPDSKTGQKAIRINRASLNVLNSLPRVSGNPYVIVGRQEGTHLINLQKPWRRIRGLAGLDDVRIHDLRHTFASVAAASGASLPVIGKLLGHARPETTARYAHLAEDPIKQFNEDVGESISQVLLGAKS